jgi:hypothetical protein
VSAATHHFFLFRITTMSDTTKQDTARAELYAESRALATELYRQSRAADGNPQDLSGEEAHQAWSAEAAQYGDDWLVADLARVHLPSFVAQWNAQALAATEARP